MSIKPEVHFSSDLFDKLLLIISMKFYHGEAIPQTITNYQKTQLLDYPCFRLIDLGSVTPEPDSKKEGVQAYIGRRTHGSPSMDGNDPLGTEPIELIQYDNSKNKKQLSDQ